MMPILRNVLNISSNHWLLIVAGIVLYGEMIELIQPFVNRYGEWMDFFANTAGVATGVLLGRLVRKMDSRVN
ncbi:MAG: hypothetical protein HOL17_06435 [Gammaproteobacteria bacterium]|jgi:membrane associated rhomboid family serine protease|nr:hypothetical protein [Gammaproteobacteria bacterium]MBT4812069.1 hypothetical protein [Thiotrichales bacterium]MBT3968157.1 hypothetical protein [Gammaproteobacteria bacterium]MBT5371344.1 hypothetical protein [Gammaproteobacteria bacterium]MBT5746950.1 hypothetical protein [Gammaproteobacteria bacterium]